MTNPAQYPVRWQQHIGEVAAAGYELDDRPCFEFYHHVDPVTKVADVSFCTSIKGLGNIGASVTQQENKEPG